MEDDDYLDFSTEEDKSNAKKLDSRLREVYDHTGLEGLKEYVTDELNRWKGKIISIAVTGSSGAGKSSLINALRCIDQDDENAAEEGPTETTFERQEYPFPSNEKIVLYDIPGAGTPLHPNETYIDDMKFDQYNFVVIVGATRFTETDAMIAKELQRLSKPFFLVRSKIGFDVNNKKKTQTRDDVIDKIRKDCLLNLEKLDVQAVDIFLVDSHVHEDFELGKLQRSIADNAPEEALKSLLIFSYRNMTKEIIEAKIKLLKNRAKMVALQAVASAAPGAGYLMDSDVITGEITFYKKELGLDDKSLDEMCNILGVDMTEIKTMISFTDLSFQENMIKIFSETDDKFDVKQICLRFLLECFGSSLLAFYKSYGKVYNTLCKILEILHVEALVICERILEKKRQ
ncbi:interferon-gamma-inducible GTPase 10-like [Ruditapes philippinarum]|uniref:interferon-gamma-inducible GTPase 10-like n=1 Tax=Ruditapes philippinarum TaxID=129788 RepID=UPI00295BC560|nr:interferon-gamma-inducible GTPase 10-like [Ruditapes philippinarum]